MPTFATISPEVTTSYVPPRKRWTREQCAPLQASGLFETERLELVAGELISKMGKNRLHVNSFRLMLIWLQRTFGNQFVDAEAPIDVHQADNSTSEPEPDLVVLNRPCDSILSGNPHAGDIRLVVEIADSSLNFDLAVKAALYARAAIAEYWVLDVSGRRLLVHREPADGRYSSVLIYEEDELVAPLSAPEVLLRVADVFVAVQHPDTIG